MGQVCCQPISHARPHAGSPNGRSTMPAKLKDLANSPTTETRARAVFAALRRGCRRLGILSGLSNVRRRYLQITSVWSYRISIRLCRVCAPVRVRRWWAVSLVAAAARFAANEGAPDELVA